MTTVDDLLQTPFSRRTIQERREIIWRGRPTPPLSITKDCKVYQRHFQANSYDRIQWLCGCPNRNKLFCWPCLLFSTETGVWNNVGFDNLSSFSTAIQRHERSQSHLHCMIRIKTFDKTKSNSSLSHELNTSDVMMHNENVRHNRRTFRRFIDCACFLARQNLPLRASDEASEKPENYSELLSLISNYDPILRDHLQNSNIFSSASSDIQDDLVQCINSVLIQEIKAEIRSSEFVSLQVDETGTSDHSQLSCILRFTRCGRVVERFIGLLDISDSLSAECISREFFNLLALFECTDRLIAQTFDGAIGIASRLGDFQTRMKERVPSYLSTYCSAYSFQSVLINGVRVLNECNIFFSTLSGLVTFFGKSTKRTQVFQKIVRKKIPDASEICWNSKSNSVQIVFENLDSLISFFHSVHDVPDGWDSDTICASVGYVTYLKSFTFTFLLVVFTDIFALTETLSDTFQASSLDVHYCLSKMSQTSLVLKSKLDNFEQVWGKCFACVETSTPYPANKAYFRKLYVDILNNVLDQITARFSDMEKISFIDLLNPQKFNLYVKSFPMVAFRALKSLHPTMFDYSRIHSELLAMYSSVEFRFLHAYQIFNFLFSTNLNESMPQIDKLCRLILTIPSTPTSAECSLKLKRVRAFCRKDSDQSRSKNSCIISVEEELLSTISSQQKFFDDVIKEFIKRNRGIDLVYK